jgi:hypothetical protein
VIATANDLVSSGVCSGHTNRGRANVRSGFTDPDHFSIRDQIAHELRDLIFEAVHETKCDAVFQLAPDSVINSLIAVAQDERADTHVEVDVFVTVNVPDVAILSLLCKFGSHSIDILAWTFRKSLRDGGHDAKRLPV